MFYQQRRATTPGPPSAAKRSAAAASGLLRRSEIMRPADGAVAACAPGRRWRFAGQQRPVSAAAQPGSLSKLTGAARKWRLSLQFMVDGPEMTLLEPSRTRVFVAGGGPVLVAALRAALNEPPNLVVGARPHVVQSLSGLAPGTADLVRHLQPDVVLLTLQQSDLAVGLSAVRDIAEACKDARILTLLDDLDWIASFILLRAGVSGILGPGFQRGKAAAGGKPGGGGAALRGSANIPARWRLQARHPARCRQRQDLDPS